MQAQQLKLSGEATPRQIQDVRAQLELLEKKQRGDDGPRPLEGVKAADLESSSRMCSVM